MTTVLKINQGTAEKLLQWSEIKAEQSKNLTGKELTLELDTDEVFIEPHKGEYRETLEISDAGGSFGLWVELTEEKIQKLKNILEKY